MSQSLETLTPLKAIGLVAVVVLLPVAFFVISCLGRLSYRFMKYKKNKSKYSKVPQHHLGMVSFQMMDFHRDISKDVDKFKISDKSEELYDLVDIGPDFMGDETVVIADAELAGQVLSAPDVYKFPKSPFYKIVGDALLGNGLVTSGGELWRSHRHIVTPLFHFKSLKNMIEMMILYTNDLVEDLEENGAKEYRAMHSVLSKFTLAQIVYLAFGGAMDIDWMHERQCAIGDLYTKYLAQRIFFGSLVRFVPFTPGWKLFTYRREVENMMRNIIKQARRDATSQKTSGSDMTEGVNLINTMINAKDPATGKPVSDEEIVEECCTVLFAGFDTTAVTLSWTLYYLANDPDALRWVQEEVDNILGGPKSYRPPTMEDLASFKRVRATINETLRLRPPAWTVPRWTDNDVKIGDYEIPANTIIEVNLTIIHRNPKYWKNPNDFIPRRWTDEEETSRHPFAFVPFSAGARNCVGKNFAIQEMIIALSILLSHFTIELDPARPMHPRGNPVPLPDCYVKFHKRQ